MNISGQGTQHGKLGGKTFTQVCPVGGCSGDTWRCVRSSLQLTDDVLWRGDMEDCPSYWSPGVHILEELEHWRH